MRRHPVVGHGTPGMICGRRLRIPDVAGIPSQLPALQGCACRNSNPDILVVQSTQDRTAKNVSSALNGARCRRILVQR